MRRLADHFRVYAVTRAPRLPKDATMADIAAQHADAILDRFSGPVDVLGVSSGGSVALQLAADRPDTVRRLVIVSSGYRLSTDARTAQMRYVEATAAGRRGAQYLAAQKVNSRIGTPITAALMWLFDPLLRPADPSDMVVFARAENDFDLGDRLSDITAPTLVIAGASDRIYPPDIVRDTAAGVRHGELISYSGIGHGGTLTHRSFSRDVTNFLTATGDADRRRHT